MTRNAPTDLLALLIEEAVERALARSIPKIVAATAVTPAIPDRTAPVTSKFDELPDDAFIVLSDAAKLFSAHRTTMLRLEFQRKLPPRIMRGGKSGWLLGQLRHALRNLPQARRHVQRIAASH